MERGADVNFRFRGRSPLEAAVAGCDIKKSELLLGYGAKIDDAVLYLAIHKKVKHTLRLLLGASPSAPDRYSDTLKMAFEAWQSIPSDQPDCQTAGVTTARIRAAWEDGLNAYKDSVGTRVDSAFAKRWEEARKHEKPVLARRLCSELYQDAKNEQNHFECLDRRISRINMFEHARKARRSEIDDGPLVNGAGRLLGQLPPTPLPLSPWTTVGSVSSNYSLSPNYFMAGDDSEGSDTWEGLQVAALTSTSVIKTAFDFIRGSMEENSNLIILDRLGQILRAAVGMSHIADNSRSSAIWYIVTSFLWKMWHQTRTLFLSFRFQDQLESGLAHRSSAIPEFLEQFEFPDEILCSV